MNIEFFLKVAIVGAFCISIIILYVKLWDLSSSYTSLKNNYDSINALDVNQQKSLQLLTSNIAQLEQLQQVNASLSDGLSVGSIIASASNSVPDSYLVCDGSQYSISQYQDLFVSIGGTYNNSSNTDTSLYFNVPDLRGIFLRGLDSKHKLGQYEKYATALPVSNSFVTDSQGSHSHSMDSQGNHVHDIAWTYINNDSQTYAFTGPNISRHYMSTGNTDSITPLSIGTSNTGAHVHTIMSNGGHAHSIVNGGDSETRPNNISLIYLIKAR